MEESFEKLEGVEEVISGYSGGITKNPTYREVTHGDSGHFGVVEIIYDKEKISYEELLKNFWINIDPFDAYGQFCDKGYSYRSVAFYENDYQKDLIESDIKKFEKKFKPWGFIVVVPFLISSALKLINDLINTINEDINQIDKRRIQLINS